MDTLQYGIFRLGQVWTLTDPDGARLGFPSREIAIAALQTMLTVQRARHEVVVTLQGGDGRLRTLLNPSADLRWEDDTKGSAWDALLEVPRARPCLSGA